MKKRITKLGVKKSASFLTLLILLIPISVSAAAYSQGDVNHDGAVNIADTKIVLTNYNRTVADLNSSGIVYFDPQEDDLVNSFDFGWIIKKWGQVSELENVKDLSKYSDREVFLVSDQDWKQVSTLIPVTTWTNKGDIYQYPTLIYHQEGSSFDVDSIIYFFQQYSPDKVTVIGNTPRELTDLLIAQPELGVGLSPNQIGSITTDDYLSYWDSYKNIVYSQDNYELVLLASSYASLINAPLIIKGFNDNLDLVNKDTVCVGEVNYDNCYENYNLEELQQKYVTETETNKIILININDPNLIVDESFTPEKTPNMIINELYSKSSLAAPILASGKHEIILSTTSINYQSVDSFLENKINSLGLDPEYLTIIASPIAIQMSDGENSIDQWHYSQLDDGYLDLAVGRIFSLTISDVSSNIARSLFYETILQHEAEILVTRGYPYMTSAADVYAEGQVLSALGYQITTTPEGTSRDNWKNKLLIHYLDHGSNTWAGIHSTAIPYLDNTFVIADGCSTCAFEQAFSQRRYLFCTHIIRKGGIGTISTVTNGGGMRSPIITQFLSQNFSLGKAIMNFKHWRMVRENRFDLNPLFISRFVLLGDPTLKIRTPYAFAESSLTFLDGSDAEKNYRLTVPAMKIEIPDDIKNLCQYPEYVFPHFSPSVFFHTGYQVDNFNFGTRIRFVDDFEPNAVSGNWKVNIEQTKDGVKYLWLISPLGEPASFFPTADGNEFQEFEFDLTLSIKGTCSDGTIHGECSQNNLPWYCDSASSQLIEKCSLCGCPEGAPTCLFNETCQS